MELGKFNTLTIKRRSDNGFYLADEEGAEVLLPNKYISDNHRIKKEAKVFIYKDSEDRFVATTLEPYLIVGEFAYLEVNETNEVGAFLDWGLEKDLLVPFNEQHQKMVAGNWYVIFLYVDDKTERLVGTSKLDKYLETETIDVKEGDKVNLVVRNFSDLGANVIVQDKYKGLIYKEKIFKRLQEGDFLEGFVKTVRDDGKLDIVLEQEGFHHIIEPVSAKILETLKESNGFLDLTDKSTPEEIKSELEISKKVFKKALGWLYKHKLIIIKEDGIYLIIEAEKGEENI
jgi:predicted RNA-binding protein (virulence factor B family)